MGPLTIQILILVASFLIYRILKSGFDSWKSILIDFGIVIFLFGLQYYLQNKQNENNISELEKQDLFPSGAISSLVGANFPNKIANKIQNVFAKKLSTQVPKNADISPRPTQGSYVELSDSTYFEPMEKRILSFSPKFEQGNLNLYDKNGFNIKEDGFYMIQLNCQTDIIPYHAKLSILGSKNQIQKSVHDGENNFVVHLYANDKIHFEIENIKSEVMLLENTSMYMIKL